MRIFKLSYKLMISFLVVIFFLGASVYYVQETEDALWNEKSRQAEILVIGESIAKYNLELFTDSQSYLMSDSVNEHKRIRASFSSSYDNLIQELGVLENMTDYKYSAGILKTYSASIKSDFEKGSAIHDKKNGLNNSEDIAILESEELNVLRSIEDAGVKVKGAREMIVVQANKNLDESAARLDAQKSLSRSILFFAILLGIALSTYITNSITKEIIKLRAGAIEIGKGNLDIRLDIKTRDELGELGSAFNKMALEIKKSRGDILLRTQEAEASKLALESRVKELTDTKRAMLNMMEDAEEANKALSSAHEMLNANLKDLKALDVKKDEFISIAAHELKTPLTAIHGFSQLLENEDVVKNAEMRNNYLKVIDSETKRLSNIVTEVLDLSRIDLGVIKFSADDVDIYGVIEQIRGETEIKAKEKGLKLAYELEKDLPHIIVDREKFIQVIINLVTNAEKYTEKGSIAVNIKKAGDSIQFSIADTGIGIPRKHFPKMFSRFYQVDASYTRKVGGTGLGLSVCKEFIEGMGGKIWFESNAGKGSTFYFTLPVKSIKKARK